MSKFFYLFSIIIIFSTINKSAYAYLDPGIFTFFWQAIVIAIASAAVSIKLFWYKIIDTLNNLKKKFNGKKNE